MLRDKLTGEIQIDWVQCHVLNRQFLPSLHQAFERVDIEEIRIGAFDLDYVRFTLNAKIVSEVGLLISMAPFILSPSILWKNISLGGLKRSLIF